MYIYNFCFNFLYKFLKNLKLSNFQHKNIKNKINYASQT